MPPFKFRAAAALDLRHKQEQEAATALARVEAHFREANEACEAAERHRTQAQADQMAQAYRGIDVSTLFWHRNWINRLQATVYDLRADTRTKADAVDTAKRAWQLARQRFLALDRLRERATARHRAEANRQELKVIDELARIRFVMPDGAREE
jgi:flagellar export protein FliJ